MLAFKQTHGVLQSIPLVRELACALIKQEKHAILSASTSVQVVAQEPSWRHPPSLKL
jgi:hypothetical protein